jgi:hypothetical protein
LFVSYPLGPFNHLKSSLLGSNSESNINRYSTINKIPLIALNFSDGGDKKTHSPPASENTIIAPKVKDRTHNVTEKVTQVRPSSPGPPQGCSWGSLTSSGRWTALWMELLKLLMCLQTLFFMEVKRYDTVKHPKLECS